MRTVRALSLLLAFLCAAPGVGRAEGDAGAARTEGPGPPAEAVLQQAVAYARTRAPRILHDLAELLLTAGGQEREAQVLLERFLAEAPRMDALRADATQRLAALRRQAGPRRLRAGEVVKRHIDLGSRAFHGDEYPAASREFALAYAIQPAPLLLFNLAQVQRKAGGFDDALALYRRYLEEDPRSGLRAEIGVYISAMQKAQKAQRAAAERAEKERAALERAEKERAALERAEKERAALERAEADRRAAALALALAGNTGARRRPAQVAKWVLGGLGLLAAAGGATLWALDGYQSCSTLALHPCPLELDSKIAGISLLAGGAALLGTSAILFGVDARRDRGGERSALLTLSGTF